MKERIEYIDRGKGFAILLMVMGHVFAWEYPNIETLQSQYPNSYFSLLHFIYSFHMSLFFYFSGYVFKVKDNSILGFMSLCKKKFLSLILPFISFGIIYYFVFSQKMDNYWYLRTLFEICIIQAIIEIILFFRKDTIIIRILTCAVVYSLAKIINHMYWGENWFVILGIDSWAAFYYPAFCLGNMSSKYKSVDILLDKNFVYTSSLILFVLLLISKLGENPFNLPCLIYDASNVLLLPLSGVLLFRYIIKYCDFPHWFSRSLQFFGVHSLDIYLIHFFIYIEMDSLGQYTIDICSANGIINYISAFILQFCCTLFVALIISLFCIYIAKILRLSDFFSFVFFGNK